MKSSLTILLLGLFSFTTIFSQELKRTSFFIDAGTTLSLPYKGTIEQWPEVINHPVTEYAANFGYFIESLLEYSISKKWKINSGLNLNVTRLKIDYKAGVFEDKGNIKTTSLQLPLLLKYCLSERLPISFSFGPYINFMIKAKEKRTTYIDPSMLLVSEPDQTVVFDIISYDFDGDISHQYKSFNYGLSAQVNYEFRLSDKLKGTVLTKFNYGLNNIYTQEMYNANSINYWKNYNFMIGFGINI